MSRPTLFLIMAICTLSSCKKNNNDATMHDAKKDTLAEETVNLQQDTLEVKPSLFICKENDNGLSRYDDPLNKTCACKETTFEKAYKLFYDEAPSHLKENLLEKLPSGDFQVKAVSAEVSYKRILKDTLRIDVSYQGGDDYYIFYKNSNNTVGYKEYVGLP
ncbi:hypothetical protein [Flavobacterium pedocola]